MSARIASGMCASGQDWLMVGFSVPFARERRKTLHRLEAFLGHQIIGRIKAALVRGGWSTEDPLWDPPAAGSP